MFDPSIATRTHARALQSGAARVAIVAVALASLTSACDWRVETGPSPTPTADAATAARDAAALNEAAIILALEVPAAIGSGREALAAMEGAAAPAHLDILGGVYEPFPSATASPEPTPAAGDADRGDLRAAVLTARDQALDAAFAASATDGGFLAGSMGFTHAFALWFAAVTDARAAGVEVPVVAERTLPGPHGDGVSLVPTSTELDAAALSKLAVLHDQARFAYEVIAARETGAQRALALEAAAKHRARSDALTALAAQDERTPVYELPGILIDSPESRAATARHTEQALGWAYLELTSGVSAEDRAWLMSAAFDAYAAGAALPGFTVAEFPVLPGADSSP